MSSAWVAASVRARALARRRVGAAGARALAALPLPEATAALADTPYRHDVHATDDLAAAQHGAAATVLWHLRVLGGWVPRSGTPALRALAAGFEVANVDEHMRSLRSEATEPAFRLGSFATAWPRLRHTTSLRELRDELSTSAWGDPGGEGVRTIGLALRTSWASRVWQSLPQARYWVAGAGALLVLRERWVADRRLPEVATTNLDPVLGLEWASASSMRACVQAMPPEAAWVLSDVSDPDDLWRAEASWWRRLESDGFTMVRGSSFDLEPVVGCLAVLAADAWRVRAALEVAATGGAAMELFDAVA